MKIALLPGAIAITFLLVSSTTVSAAPAHSLASRDVPAGTSNSTESSSTGFTRGGDTRDPSGLSARGGLFEQISIYGGTNSQAPGSTGTISADTHEAGNLNAGDEHGVASSSSSVYSVPPGSRHDDTATSVGPGQGNANHRVSSYLPSPSPPPSPPLASTAAEPTSDDTGAKKGANHWAKTALKCAGKYLCGFGTSSRD